MGTICITMVDVGEYEGKE